MTGQEVIDRAWSMVQDTESTKRNPVAVMVGFLNDGIEDVLSRRPALRLADDGSVATFSRLISATVASADLPVGYAYLEPLAHYLAHRVFELDADDEHNAGLSASHFRRYMEAT
jgi:hypothetical protein